MYHGIVLHSVDMTTSRSLMAEENLQCSICLEVFNRPVTIPCGHNFCHDCIANHWDTSNILFKCPLCKDEFVEKPKLRVNSVLAEMATDVKARAQEKASRNVPPDQGGVLCDICTGAKCTAVKSCLVCVASYCQVHLERHERIPALQRHKLIPAVTDPESRLCKSHNQHLELFCMPCKLFMCKSCKESHNKAHRVVKVEEEAEKIALELEKQKNDLDRMIQRHQTKIDQLHVSVQDGKAKAMSALTYSSKMMSAVADLIKKSQDELAEVIRAKQQKIEEQAAGFIGELENEIVQMKQNYSQLSQISASKDPHVFLENFLSFTICQVHVEDRSALTVSTDNCPIEPTLINLAKKVNMEIRMLCDPYLKVMQQHAVDVHLDPDTANPFLFVSEDGKQVQHECKKQNVLSKPQRFDHVLNVLAKEGFTHGRFYYEVQVKGKTSWDLGVASQSINRKGDIRLSPKNGYWTIWLRKGSELTANDATATTLSLTTVPEKVGVFVDFEKEKGQVSFYDVDARACLYRFTECNFTGQLHPFFSPSSNDDGKNSDPLIITPVNRER